MPEVHQLNPYDAELLRAARKARRLSSAQVAKRAGISQRHLLYLEAAQRAPSRVVAERLADVLGVPAAAAWGLPGVGYDRADRRSRLRGRDVSRGVTILPR